MSMSMTNEPQYLVSGPAAAAADEGGLERTRAFEELAEAEHERLYSALWLVTRDRTEAEDIMQEAFLRLWERWDRVRGMDDPTGYLYRTAMNVHRDRIRRASLAIRRAIRISSRTDDLADVETRDEVLRALGTLTKRQRMSLVLVDLLDFRSEEAARLMGIKAATIRVLASQGRAALRRNAGGAHE
jgi:RNA polymerase sigma-70 factor (ECF subfamily)